jgi:HlyD family secretion protein
MKTKILPILSVVVLLLATASIVRTHPHMDTNAPQTAPPRSDFDVRVASVGIVEPCSENISIASHLPGVVEKVFVAAGQEVKAGDSLLKLDTRALEAARVERLAAIETAKTRARKARAEFSDAKNNLHFAEAVSDSRSISAEELSHRKSAVEIAAAALAESDAAIASAEANLKTVETEIARSTINAPVTGRVLQVRIRPGEFAPAGPSVAPWMVMGDVSALHIRVDIDEHEAWRVRPGAEAVAQVRGNANLRARARFVRFEPLVVPKLSLTGDSTERVDTRVLQAIYKIEGADTSLFVGQQMDVFIDATDLKVAKVTGAGK